jgi:hypothetical protein
MRERSGAHTVRPDHAVRVTAVRACPRRWPCRPDTMCAGGRREVHLAAQKSGSHSHVSLIGLCPLALLIVD